VARYAETLLSTGERIQLRTRQHWLSTFVDARAWWALLVFDVVLIWIRLGWVTGEGAAQSVFGWIVLALLLVALAGLGRHYWSWLAQDYIVTNRRVLKVEGILNKRAADSSLEKINDAVLEQNLVGRIFGYGDLDILTAADIAIDRYRMLNQAPTFKKVMLDMKRQLEEEVIRVPSPPARAAQAARPAMTADDAERALASLAALRDKGAISADDYEAQKKELLRRL
jgi:uncharacterized membrane protein YdbT with pleckstrin-like domain